jgi:hypothetical protein
MCLTVVFRCVCLPRNSIVGRTVYNKIKLFEIRRSHHRYAAHSLLGT